MYNENQKNIYFTMSHLKKESIEQITGFFNRIEIFEKEYGKDFCNFNMEQARTALSATNGKSLDTLKWQRNILNAYCKWCVESGYSFQNPVELLKAKEIDRSRFYEIAMLKDPQGLRDFLDVVCPPVEEENQRNIHRLFCWLIYAGISKESVFNLGQQDVIGNLVFKEGKSIEINDEAANIVKLLKQNQSFYKMCNNKFVLHPICNPNFLLSSFKPITGDKNKRFREYLAQLAKEYEKLSGVKCNLSVTRIFDSGCFYRAYQRELKQDETDCSELIEYKIMYSKNKGKNEKIRAKIENDVILSYEQWKRTFYL